MILALALHLFILRLMFNTILNLSVASLQLFPHVTYHYAQTSRWEFKASSFGIRLVVLLFAQTEQH